MMWVREIAGWLLVRTAFLFVTDLDTPRLIEGAILVVASLGVLKGGLTLIRIATAGRICTRTPGS
jgi:hypothetical protein